MTIIKGYVDPYWHESNLVILILNKGSLKRNELFRIMAEEQKKRLVFGEKQIRHSESAYKYWLKRRENQWIIIRDGNTLQLTPLGRWIANSELGTFFERADFVELVCIKCAKPANLALFVPLPDTAEVNVKGKLFMDVRCPKCGYSMNRLRMIEGLSAEDFISFYDKAVAEIKRYFNIEAVNINS